MSPPTKAKNVSPSMSPTPPHLPEQPPHEEAPQGTLAHTVGHNRAHSHLTQSEDHRENRDEVTEEVSRSLRIVVGVGGGIAAYKACHIVRALTELGHSVRVVPTEASLNFVGRATWEALSGQPVSTTVFDAVDRVQHVSVGQDADLVIIAPATADLMAKIAHGRADDLLTATVLVATCPIVIAPAMHTEMWLNAATQDNVSLLRSRGLTVLPPAHGRLTGKDSGPGRLADPDQIVNLSLTVHSRVSQRDEGSESGIAPGCAIPQDLTGARVVITAGGTHENLDPVRYLGNRSSGKQGFALAEVAAARGARVTVVAGSTAELPTPLGATVVSVESAREMYSAVMEEAKGADYLVCAAAVADFRPRDTSGWKMKKQSESADSESLTTLHLVENPDILKSVVQARDENSRQRLSEEGDSAPEGSQFKEGLVIVGFAAETGDPDHTPLEHAKAKLARKGCELLVCNDVGEGKVFGRDVNQGWVLAKDGEVSVIDSSSKFVMADAIWDAIGRWRVRAQG